MKHLMNFINRAIHFFCVYFTGFSLLQMIPHFPIQWGKMQTIVFCVCLSIVTVLFEYQAKKLDKQ